MSSDIKPLSGFTNSLNSSSTPSQISLNSDSSIASTDSSIFSSMWFWVFIVILLSGIGIYLAKGPDFFTDIYEKMYETIFPSDNDDNKSEHSDYDHHPITPSHPPTQPTQQPTQTTQPTQSMQQTHQPTQQPTQQMQQQQQSYQPMHQQQQSSDPVSASDVSNKSGWCFVGQDQNNRNCIEVGEFDTCMSGNIFSTKDLCINPNLK